MKVAVSRKGMKYYPKNKVPVNADVDMRLCLGGCNEMFESLWKGNRICPDCVKKHTSIGNITESQHLQTRKSKPGKD